MLLPFIISFVDISIRSVLQEALSANMLMYLSFSTLLFMYGIGYFFLWRMFAKRREIALQKLLELGTILIIISDLLMYASLYQAGNVLSNFIWLGFYLLLIAFFYMLGKQSINHFQTNETL